MSRLLRDTSLEAYQRLMESGDLTRMESLVMSAIIELGGAATNYQIAKHLKLPINRITGRTRALFLKEKLRQDVQMKNPESGCLNWRWKINTVTSKPEIK